MGKYANINLANLAFMNSNSLSEKKQKFKTTDIPLEKIVTNENNKYSLQDIEELKFSILHNGLKQNLEVYSIGEGLYKLISGERRYTALKALVEKGYDEFSIVPCIITDFSLNKLPLSERSKEMYAIITTNSESRDYTDADRMFQVKELKKIYTELQQNGVKLTGKMTELIAKDLDLSERQVKRLNYIETHGTDELKTRFEKNEISISAAENVAHLSPGQQKEALKNEAITLSTANGIRKRAEAKKAKRNDNTLKKNNSKIKLSDSSFFNYYLTVIKDKIKAIEKKYSSSVLEQETYAQLEIQVKGIERKLDAILKILD